MAKHLIAHDVAVEAGMAHESLSALTAVIQAGIDRALAALGEPDGMETTAEERNEALHYIMEDGASAECFDARMLRDFDRLLAREAKAREAERERAAKIAEGWSAIDPNGNGGAIGLSIAASIRSKP